ncbi:PLP-dependent aminotransferase family protein [Vitiosangium sp. GDMCC 1.1324]|uniref:MocR-like pyridoxine biosynthesis transcription factor PdxR n=1 Tax=Vitiosangium sp. (strain GDMCC 1.1324) TaxID=2138576 RepID=UPI000D34B807|nr:PLP-dependent aminotransferase family protein [Vitiosangium sp. GDMCC 1.1324]PTL85519.1 GntR family transcriptional regulator [Vitiosangium sp. GDMCC 1.1324]
MDIYLTEQAHRRGLARAIYEQIREAIVEGRIRPGDRLPPSREMAKQLAVSRYTVTTAYGFLVAEGFLEGASGAGTRVAAQPESAVPGGRVRRGAMPRHRLAGLSPMVTEETPSLHLGVGAPDTALFPLLDWRRQMARALRSLDAAGASYGDAAGDAVLRAEIATWIHRSRGVRATPEEVVITAGAQQAFDLIIGALTQPGDIVAVEDPGYVPFRKLAEVRCARVAPIPVDDSGLVVEALPSRAKLVYVTPSHQFPLGPVLSLVRRRQLLDWARTTGSVIIEDDYDSEFRFSDRPLEPLQRLDTGGRVIYVGSFSKTLAPSLRAGFLVAPRELVSSLAGLRQLVDWHSPALLQRTLAGFLSEGMMDRHLRRARKEYRARHQFIVDWFRGPGRRLGRLISVDAGLHVAVALQPGLDEARLIERARAAGLTLEGLSKYSIDTGRRGLALGYGGTNRQGLEKAFQLLSKLIPAR